MEQLLEKLFESIPKVRILRFFLQNPNNSFALDEVAQRTRIDIQHARHEIMKLFKLGLLKNRIGAFLPTVRDDWTRFPSKPKKTAALLKRYHFYRVNKDFAFLSELTDLVVKSSMPHKARLVSSMRKLGGVKLAVISGIFLNRNENGRTDLLIVADDLKQGKLENVLSKLEAEMGRSIHYTLMDTKEFRYRLNMYDRFIRDILEYPHEKLINKLNI